MYGLTVHIYSPVSATSRSPALARRHAQREPSASDLLIDLMVAVHHADRAFLVVLLLPATLLSVVDGHGAVVHPAPRNAVDRDLPPWSLPMPEHLPPVEGALCPAPDATGKITGELGQSCFWFSNGCAIGCDACDGISRGPIMHGSTRPSPYGLPWNRKFDTCSATVKSTAKPTICDEHLRTVNTNATCMGPDDIFQFSPWRAPGSAPVFDPCPLLAPHSPLPGALTLLACRS